MPNLASTLKSEIVRIARKELRAELLVLKKANRALRADVAALNRRTKALEQDLRRTSRATVKAMPTPKDEASPAARFSAKNLVAQRKRLGLSAKDCGLLVGASGLSIYKWESRGVLPKARYLAALAALRTLGKKEAAKRLAALGEAS